VPPTIEPFVSSLMFVFDVSRSAARDDAELLHSAHGR
jgi:hypothetical protein